MARLQRMRLVHESALRDPALRATLATAAASDAPQPALLRCQTARRPAGAAFVPGVGADEIKLSHSAVSSAQVAALVLFMTRAEHADLRAHVRSLTLDGNELADKQFVMLLRGMGGLGGVERLSMAHNKLSRTSVALLEQCIAANQVKHVRTPPPAPRAYVIRRAHRVTRLLCAAADVPGPEQEQPRQRGRARPL